jgi:N-acetylmuramoyl-L-alanine amidase
MTVRNHRLYRPDGSAVRFVETKNQGALFTAPEPTHLIIHYTAGGTMSGAVEWFKNAASKVSAHLVIDRDGETTQMVRFDRIAWHAGVSSWRGRSGMNKFSLGIELVNWGLLRRAADGYVTSTGRKVPESRVVLARHKNFEPNRVHAWEVFDESQFAAVVAASLALVRAYSIPIENVLGHDDVSPVRKQDPGPAFDMKRFKALLLGRSGDGDNVMRVESTTGLNLRRGPGTGFEVVKSLPDGTRVRLLGSQGPWREIMELGPNGEDVQDGWVHGNWLVEV